MQIDYDVDQPRLLPDDGDPDRGRPGIHVASDDENAPRVVIVNAAMAHRYWKRTDVVGQRIRIADQTLEIVAVVPTGKYQTLGEQARAHMYVPIPSDVCTPDGAPRACGAEIRRRSCRVSAPPSPGFDPNLPLFDVRSLQTHMAFATVTPRLAASLLGAFGVLALVLATVGLHSVLAYTVSQRTREVAIRLALGAGQADVRGLVVRQGMWLLVAGLGIGMTIAYGALPLMSPLLIGISAKNPLTFSAVGALLAVVALGASYLPARRASRVDPIVALRH